MYLQVDEKPDLKYKHRLYYMKLLDGYIIKKTLTRNP